MIKIAVFILCLFLATETYAVSAGTGQSGSKTQRIQKERGISQTHSKNISITRTQGTTTSDAKRLTTTVSLDALVFASIARLELQGGFYAQCGLILSPPLPADFGITAEIGGYGSGVIDVVKLSYIDGLAKSSASVTHINVDTEKLRQYIDCIAQYAYIVHNVLTNLRRSYGNISDLIKHIDELVGKFSKQPYVISHPDYNRCRFAHSSNAIQCGDVYIEIAQMPKLLIKKEKIMADGYYLNVSSQYTTDKSTAHEISRATSDALQHVHALSLSYRKGYDLQQQQDASTQVKTP